MATVDPYNELLYLKQQYEGAGSNRGLQDWASKQAPQYYSMLDQSEAQQIQNMNASQLRDYLGTRNQPQQQQPQQPVNDFNFQNATIQDLTNKFNFDYSREYAARQAEAEAQAKRLAAEQGMRQVDAGIDSAVENLDRNYFQQYLQHAQQQTNSGLNAGIAADQDARLAMSRQAAMGDIYRDGNLERMRLQDALGQAEVERLAREDALFNERLQQGFDNVMDYNRFGWDRYRDSRSLDLDERRIDEQSRQFDISHEWDRYLHENVSASDQAQLDLGWAKLEEEKQQFRSEEDWKWFTYNNMSEEQKARFEQNERHFGEEMAWRMHEADLMMKYRYDNMAFDAGYAGTGGGNVNSNATPGGEAFNAQYGADARRIQQTLRNIPFRSENERSVVANSLANALDWTNRSTTYKWGGGRKPEEIARGEFDCSSFVQHVFKQQGINLGSTTREQRNQGTKVAVTDMRPGDLVFFDTNRKDGHVGIYMGNGQFVGAQSSTGVAVVDMNNQYWKSRFNGHVRRVT